MKTYSLVPFASETPKPGDRRSVLEKLLVHVTYTETRLSLGYQLIGQITDIEWADITPTPQRREQLWEQTCFEFFLTPQNSSQYWEFNLSPSHDWNCYRFQDYRTGMAHETAWPHSPFQVDQPVNQGLPRSDSLQNRYLLNCQIDLLPLFPQPVSLQLGVTMVIAEKNGTLSYWALSHPAPNADFHQRDSWLISLTAAGI